MKELLTTLRNALNWLWANKVGICVLLTQWIAIVISVKHRHEPDFVIWLWGSVAVVAAALFEANPIFKKPFWTWLIIGFSALGAFCGYFLLT